MCVHVVMDIKKKVTLVMISMNVNTKMFVKTDKNVSILKEAITVYKTVLLDTGMLNDSEWVILSHVSAKVASDLMKTNLKCPLSGPDCEDIDECETGAHDCPADQICSNRDGSYECICHDGFQKSNGKCIGKNEQISKCMRKIW